MTERIEFRNEEYTLSIGPVQGGVSILVVKESGGGFFKLSRAEAKELASFLEWCLTEGE